MIYFIALGYENKNCIRKWYNCVGKIKHKVSFELKIKIIKKHSFAIITSFLSHHQSLETHIHDRREWCIFPELNLVFFKVLGPEILRPSFPYDPELEINVSNQLWAKESFLWSLLRWTLNHFILCIPCRPWCIPWGPWCLFYYPGWLHGLYRWLNSLLL